jgi:short-subunit dehydrogenase
MGAAIDEPEVEMRTVAITGASAGVGRATVRAFAQQGWSVGLLARGEDGLLAAASEAKQLGGRALAVPTDVAQADAVERAADRIEAELGPIEVWVNDAMVTTYSPLAEMNADEFRRITEVVYLRTVHGTMAALRRMRPRDRGTVVQVGSALAYRSIPLQSAYCGAKFAIRGFTDAVRSELLHERSGVRLSMVQLPAIDTPQFDWARNRMPQRPRPPGQVHTPEMAAQAILRAAEQAPRELWVGAPTLQLIAGNALAPALLDRMLARNAYEGQQSETSDPGGRPDYIDAPLSGDHGAHGRFSAEAAGHALVLDPDTLRAGLAFGAAALVGLVAGRNLLTWRR